MSKRLKLSWLDIVLVIIFVGMGVVTFSTSRANANAQKEKVRLDARLTAAELNLSQIEEVNLEALRHALQQAQATLGKDPFPSEAEAVAFNSDILQSAEGNNVNIIIWNSSYTPTVRRGRGYAIIRHSLNVEESK